MDFAILVDHRVKINESEKRDNFMDLAREQKKKPVEYKGDRDTNCNLCDWNGPQKLVKGVGTIGNKRTCGDHPNYSIG